MRIYFVYFFQCLIFTSCMMEIYSTYVSEKYFIFLEFLFILIPIGGTKKVGQGTGARKQKCPVEYFGLFNFTNSLFLITYFKFVFVIW